MFCLKNSENEIPIEKKDIFIGSSPDSDIVVDDPGVPEAALKLTTEGSSYSIETITASKEVLLNGRKVKKEVLKAGDVIRAGKAEFQFVIKGEERSKEDGSIYESIVKFTENVGRERDLRVLLRKVIDSLVKLLDGTEAFVFTINKEGAPEVFVSSTDADAKKRFSDTIVQQVLQSRSGICIPNALSDPSFSKAPSIMDLKLKTVLCCPMIVAEKVIGVIYLGSHVPSRSFTNEDMRALGVYAQLAGMAINHVEYISQQSTIIRKLSEPLLPEGIIARSPQMIKIIRDIDAISQSDISILLQGETGTGKEVLAQLVHNRSSRKNGPFMAVNCSSLRGELLESELFGHKKGSFTGAVSDHAGLFSAANNGTLFLDEIGEMDIQLQAKLLRTLETGKVRPVGAVNEEQVNVRIVCATNRHLEKMVEESAFRKDLYYRLNQFVIKIPPLRERGDDILYLAYSFLEKYRAQYPHKTITDFHPDSLKALMIHEWPGNVRELSSIIHRAVLTASGPAHKPSTIKSIVFWPRYL